jgi:TolB-like protein
MKKGLFSHGIIGFSFTVFIFFGLTCASPPPSNQIAHQTAEHERQSSQQISREEIPTQQRAAASASPFWTGNGGRGMTLAVLEPEGNGLTEDEMRWVTSIIQSSITGDFNRFSAMTIVDRQNLEKIIDEQAISLSGHFSDDDFISIGQLTNVRYILAGAITRAGNVFMLELAVTDLQTGVRKASYPPTPVSLQSLENLSAVKTATAELLGQLDVSLTGRGRQELSRVVDASTMQAEIALARGITAQRQGMEVEALSYFLQANNFDPSLNEIEKRLNIISASITGDTTGVVARNEIAWRRQWIERLQETENFYRSYIRGTQPHYLIFDTNIKEGDINFHTETMELSFGIRLLPEAQWTHTINEVILTVEGALRDTGRADAWGLDWPFNVVSMTSPFENRTGSFSVVAEIVNEQGRSIGRQTVSIPYGFSVRYGMTIPRQQWQGNISFQAVDTNLITEHLTVRIVSIDGIPVEEAARQKRITIIPEQEFGLIVRPSGIAATNEAFFTINDHGTITRFTGTQSSIVIPSIIRGTWVVEIGTGVFQSSFENRERLTSVTIPNGVRIIGDNAFRVNQRLTNIIIPDSVRTIGANAFNTSTFSHISEINVNSVTIGANVNLLTGGQSWPNTPWPFGRAFSELYEQNGRRAGTFTRSGSSNANVHSWTFTPR